MEVRKVIADCKTIPETMDVLSREFHGRDALRYREKAGDPYSGKITFDRIPTMAKTIATALVEQFGAPAGKNVGFIAENRPEYNLGDMSVLYAGAMPWGLYDYDIKSDEIVEYKLNDSETELMFVSPSFLESMRKIIKRGNTGLKKLIVMDMLNDGAALQANEASFSDILKNGVPKEDVIAERLDTINEDSTSRIIYTSGTTGKPKGVMLTHSNLLNNIKGCAKVLDAKHPGRMISYLPEAHSFQGFLSYLALMGGFEIWFANKKTMLDDIKEIRPTLMPGVPLVYKRFAEGMRKNVLHLTKGKIDIGADYSKNPIKRYIRGNILGPLVAKKAGLDKIEIMISGSAKLDQEFAKCLRNVGFTVFEGYGISETAPAISTETMTARRVGSVGKPIPNVTVRILSLEPDDKGVRHEMPVGETGEICVKGPNVFKGYYKDPEKTAEVRVDGEYFTGDLGHLDADGFLYVHGRAGLQVKMNNGEFVDLDHLGANILRNTELVQAAVVDAEMADYAVAIVSLAWEPETLEKLGEALGVPFTGNAAEFAKNEKVVAAVKNELAERAKSFGNPKSPSTPRKYLYVAPMSPETGEITSTMKMRVKNVIKKYKEQLDAARTSKEDFIVYIP